MLFSGSKRSVRGSSFQVEGPITEKALRCLSAERARGTKSSPRAEERRARREARSETGLQSSVKYDGAQPVIDRQTSAFHTWCFPFALICHWISIVFLLYGRRIATHSVDPSLTHFLGEFQAWDWLWYPMLWSQRRNSGAPGAENSIQISALAGVEPRTLASTAHPSF